MKKTTALSWLVTLIMSVSLGGLAYSHSGVTGIVKERMDAMKDMGDKSKAVANMFKGKAPYDQAAIIDAADSFVLHGKRITEVFPDTHESRHGKKTEALPAIWEEWDDFTALVDEFVALSEDLVREAQSGADERTLKSIFFKTAKSCSGCHKRFRKPKK
jgi:cytochrome c556